MADASATPPRPQRTQIMTLAEIAKYLGVHPMTVYRMLNTGRLPGFKLGRQWRTKKDVLDAWLVTKIHHQQSPQAALKGRSKREAS